MTDINQLDEFNIYPLNTQFNFGILELSCVDKILYDEKITFYGLCCKNNGALMFYDIIESSYNYLYEHIDKLYGNILVINGVALTINECDYALTIAYCLLGIFNASGLCDLIFLQYLCKCLSNKEIYCKKVWNLCF